MSSCFVTKFKHGCEVWDAFNNTTREIINKLIPETMKRVMELPGSTPTLAIQHDMGLIDLDIEVNMERILIVWSIEELEEVRIVRILFENMYRNKVPGFCTAVSEARKMFKLEGKENVNDKKREYLKRKMIEIQKERIIQGMLASSKCDGMLMNFSFDGKMKRYLTDLPFREARIIFMYRAKMFPTKANFKGRWSMSVLCPYCCNIESDEHLFGCCGYVDLIQGKINHLSLMKLEGDKQTLSLYAKILIQVHDRLLIGKEDNELN